MRVHRRTEAQSIFEHTVHKLGYQSKVGSLSINDETNFEVSLIDTLNTEN